MTQAYVDKYKHLYQKVNEKTDESKKNDNEQKKTDIMLQLFGEISDSEKEDNSIPKLVIKRDKKQKNGKQNAKNVKSISTINTITFHAP